MVRVVLVLLFALAARATAEIKEAAALRILTINVWSGLDYRGLLSCGEYESPLRREARFQLLVREIKALDPDLIFVQEANGRPVRPYCSRLARFLGYDEIHQICLAGMKLGYVGIPANLNEGNGILAKRSLDLEKLDEWKLGGSPGIYSDYFAFHWDETISALAGRIRVNGAPLYLVCVHLSAGAPDEAGSKRREKEIRRLVKQLRRLPESSPLIVAGDFNATPDSREMRLFAEESGCRDAFAARQTQAISTWDPRGNENAALGAQPVDARGRKLDAQGTLEALSASYPSRLDYVLLRAPFQIEDVRDCRVVMDSAGEWQEHTAAETLRTHVSDHYGVLAEVDLRRALAIAPRETGRVEKCIRPTREALPIVMYDTDIGYGYGAKFFARHLLGKSESVDLTLFGSSKGERWFKAVFSIPDRQIRQGKQYPLALDVTAEYDQWIHNSFFGVGNNSRYEDREYYTREPYSFTAAVSRGFSSRVVGELSLAHKIVRHYRFEKESRLRELSPDLNHGRVYATSATGSLRYDSRDDFLHPTRGVVLRGDFEWAPDGLSNAPFTRWQATAQSYTVLFYPKTVLALRAQLQQMAGNDLPVQVLPSIGGNSTLRGSPQDRYLDQAAAIVNAELRFPIWWRFGGVAGMDAGRVWHNVKEISRRDWASNPVMGLRFYMDTFVVRVDVGLGRETTGLYFNFGHAF
jgi:endonuclease/exonuclease/phosphatase family metal-dependent hydrolase